MTLFSSARVSYFSYPNNDNADANKDSSNQAAHLVDHLLKKIEEINVWIQLIFGSDRSSRNANVRSLVRPVQTFQGLTIFIFWAQTQLLGMPRLAYLIVQSEHKIFSYSQVSLQRLRYPQGLRLKRTPGESLDKLPWDLISEFSTPTTIRWQTVSIFDKIVKLKSVCKLDIIEAGLVYWGA